MSEIHFAQPQFLWTLAALPLFALLLIHAERRRREALDRLIAARLQQRLAGNVSHARRRWGFVLMLLGLALAIFALARPQMGFTWEERKQSGRDIIIAVDTSRSMLATDLQPNRLTRAKLAAQDLLGELAGDRVGLLAFAGSTFLQAPLTADFDAVRDSLQELDTEIIPRGGTNLSGAIKAAADAFGKSESEHQALIIFSDGEELEEDAVEIARANKDRFRIFTVGLGSVDGALIPLMSEGSGTDFVRDEQGQYVKSRLDEKRMREVAEAAGGFYVPLQNGPAEMRQIVRDGLGKMKERETDARFSRQPIERYQWPLAAAMAAIVAALLLGERRRGSMIARVAAALVLLWAPPVEARHAGIEKFEQKDYSGALGEFDGELKKRELAELHFNAGTAAYELGDYARAADAFSRALGTAAPELKPRATYNFANTLAHRGVKHEKKEDKLGDLKEALRQYDEVLSAEPGHVDAKHNRDIVAKLIEELEKEDKKDEQKKDQQDQQKDDKDKKDQQKNQDSSQGGKNDQQKQQQQDSKQDGSGKDDKEKQDKQESQGGGKEDKEKKDSQQKGEGQEEKKDDAGQKDPNAGKQGPEQKQGDEKSGERKDQQPEPQKGEPDTQKSGELKAANPGQQEQDKEKEQTEAAEASAAAQEGRMTEKDAAQMLEALRRFDRRVRLLDPKDEPVKNPSRPFKNW
jgi:Ca-activated chloride channel homolog